jgi:hypothetical protein
VARENIRLRQLLRHFEVDDNVVDSWIQKNDNSVNETTSCTKRLQEEPTQIISSILVCLSVSYSDLCTRSQLPWMQRSRATRTTQFQINSLCLNLLYGYQTRRKWNRPPSVLHLRAACRAESVMELRLKESAFRRRLHLLPVNSLHISPPIPAPILLHPLLASVSKNN